jgi:polyisoprenoid-binding protein YceI
MHRSAAVLGALVLAAAGALAQTTWTVDKAHSYVKFSISHLVIAEVEGSFREYDGTVQSTTAELPGAAVDFSVDVSSISTGNDMRDNHLKSDDFFNAGKFPKMTFKSTSWTKTGDNTYRLEGNLTIRDVMKPVTFAVTYAGSMKDSRGNLKAGIKATAVVNRFDYNLKWNAVTEAGGAVAGKDVTITLALELGQKQPS